ncbi:MAG TPA: hypothetical protein VJC04_00350 [Candidatus Paceibacterota bacterium]
MKKASVIVSLFLVWFLTLALPIEAQTPPSGYFQHGDFYCNSNTNFEKPDSALGKKFCQPQTIGCQTIGGKFCTAGTRNICCPADNACGQGTALKFWEVAVCVQPTASTCEKNSRGYAGRTKDGQNVCCPVGQEPGPAGGTSAPYCQPKSASTCAPGERFVQGLGDNQGEKRCCSANTVPSHHPNGLPFCAIPSVPSISIISPAPDVESISGSWFLTATFAAPPGRYVNKIQLFIDNTLEKTKFFNQTFSPASAWSRRLLTWKLPTGPHKIKFTVTDNNDKTASAERLVDIVPDTTPPLVEITNRPIGDEEFIPFTPAEIISGLVFINARAKDQSGIGDFRICVNTLCNDSCPTTMTGSYVYCSVSIPISRLISANQPNSTVTAVALDRAHNPNPGAAGVLFSTR